MGQWSTNERAPSCLIRMNTLPGCDRNPGHREIKEKPPAVIIASIIFASRLRNPTAAALGPGRKHSRVEMYIPEIEIVYRARRPKVAKLNRKRNRSTGEKLDELHVAPVVR